LKLLNDYLSDLKNFSKVDFRTYTENKLIRRAVERTLHLSVEASLDIGQQIIALEGLTAPTDNKGVFTQLTDAGIIPAQLLPNLIRMAQFRNLIVHDYARIDDAAVYGILSRHLTDFDAFTQAVLDYLDRK